MAVGDSFTPECRSAYVRRALAVSIVTYSGSVDCSALAARNASFVGFLCRSNTFRNAELRPST
jgi:hypothetical protein